MGLYESDKIDAIGIEKSSGKVILSIFDGLDWQSSYDHLVELQAKLNAYFDFVESGQMEEAYPASSGREVVINIITKQVLHPLGQELLERAAEACGDLNIEIRTQVLPDSGNEA